MPKSCGFPKVSIFQLHQNPINLDFISSIDELTENLKPALMSLQKDKTIKLLIKKTFPN